MAKFFGCDSHLDGWAAALWVEGRIHPTVTKAASLPRPSAFSQADVFSSPLVQSFGHCLCTLYWPGRCCSTHRRPYSVDPESLKWEELSSKMRWTWISLLPPKEAPGPGCCVVIPAESANIVSLLKHVRTEVNALNDPQPQGLNTSVVRIMVISSTHSNDQ